MNAVKVHKQQEFISSSMSKPAAYSFVLHLFVFVLATVGIPYIADRPVPMDLPITVELVDLDEISQTNVNEEPQESEIPDVPVKRKPLYNKSEDMPDLLSPKEPDVEDSPDIPEPPKENEKPEVTKIEAPPKPKNKPRKPEAKTEERPKEDEKDFTSLLKSLTPDEAEDGKENQLQTKNLAGQTSQIADFSKQMTRSELDDLNRGVQPCWNVNAGGKNAEELIVDLRVYVNPDLRVRDVQIIDQIRYGTDTHFRAAAEAARRALLNPRCSVLRLPPEKYEYWKVFIYTFDPSQML